MSATPKKTVVAKKAKKTAVPSAHPPVAQMVNAAIKNLKDRKGSSLAAIKKYISANYKADASKLAPFIRRYLKKAVETGKLSQVKGTGASGSFRLPKVEKKEKKVKKPVAKKAKKAKKPAAAKKAKTPKKAAKKPKTPKKAAAAKKPAAAKKAAKPKKAKTPKKKPAAKKTAAKK